jgi:membrane associated rhomboid family serine protease
MDRLLARLERRLGKLAIENVATILVAGMAIVFLTSLAQPGFQQWLTLDMRRVSRGEVWRLVTYLFLPGTREIWWIVFDLYWVWMIVASLESEWGAFKLNVYYLVGMGATTIAAIVSGGAVANMYLNVSCVFAVATLFPNYEILVLGIVPVKMRWLGWIGVAYCVRDFVSQGRSTKAAIVAAMVNYFLFFGPHLVGLWRSRSVEARQGARRVSERAPPSRGATGGRACAICGAREDDGADIRVCSCERCQSAGGARTLCLEHARNH